MKNRDGSAAPTRGGRSWPTTGCATPARPIALVVAETPGGGARRGRGDRRRLRRPAGARRDRRGRAGDPPRGAGQPRLRLGVRRRGGGGAGLRRGGARDAARARRQPGDGDADGAARLLRRVGRTGGCTVGFSGQGVWGLRDELADEARAADGGGAGDDAGRGRRLRDQGLQLSGVLRRRLRGARARAAGALDEHPRRGDADRQRRARPRDGGGGGVRRRLPAAGAPDRLRLEPRRLQRARTASTSPRSWR